MATQNIAIDSELLFELELLPVPSAGEPSVQPDINAAIRYLLDAYREGGRKAVVGPEAGRVPDSERDWSGSGISG